MGDLKFIEVAQAGNFKTGQINGLYWPAWSRQPSKPLAWHGYLQGEHNVGSFGYWHARARPTRVFVNDGLAQNPAEHAWVSQSRQGSAIFNRRQQS